MASTITLKKSSTPGNVPNTVNITTAELAINTADKILYSSDGSLIFEIGANLTSQSVGALTISGTVTAGGGVGTNGQVLTSNGTGVEWTNINSVVSGNFAKSDYIFTATEGQTVFSGADDTGDNLSITGVSTDVYVNGVLISNDANTNFTSNTTAITFTSGVANNDIITIRVFSDFILGTPANNQIAVWRSASELEGDAALTFDTTNDTLNVGATNDGTFQVGGVTIIDNGGANTVSLNNIFSLDATTENTIETAIDALSGVTMTNTILDGSVTEEIYAWSTTTGSNTTEFDPVNGTVHTLTLTGNMTSVTDNVAAGESFIIGIDDGTAYTFAWPTITWVNNGGSAPTLATSGYTWVAVWKVSTTLYGALIGDGT